MGIQIQTQIEKDIERNYYYYTLILNHRNLFLILNHSNFYLFFLLFIVWPYFIGVYDSNSVSSDAFSICSFSYFPCPLLVFSFFSVSVFPCPMEFLVAPFLFCMRPCTLPIFFSFFCVRCGFPFVGYYLWLRTSSLLVFCFFP